MKIGFIGLGLMGGPMAGNLLKAGHAVQVHDLRREAAKPLLEAGATWSDTPAAGVDVVFTSLPGPAEVAALAPAILAQAAPGTAWFDLSTNAPDVVRRIQKDCAAKNVRFLDAPVSGGPRGAQTGRLAIMIGGDAATFEAFLPVIRAIGDQPFYVGPIGAGNVAKLAHNATSFMLQAALAEAMTLGVKAGVEPLALWRALRQGVTGRARTFDRLADQFLPGTYDPAAFALKLAHKDMKLVLELAKSQEVPMAAAQHALDELEAAMQRGWQDRDCRVAMTLQEERAGVQVRVAPDLVKRELAG